MNWRRCPRGRISTRDSIDVVISNCVLNLVPDKDRAFREIHRVLKSGGRLAVSDMAWEIEPAASVRKSMEALVGCIGGVLGMGRKQLPGFPEICYQALRSERNREEGSMNAYAPEVERKMKRSLTR